MLESVCLTKTTSHMSSTSVFEAAAAGDIDYLKSHNSELSTKNDRGWTPLHFAARYGQLDAVTYLVEQKVPTEITNPEGKVRIAPSKSLSSCHSVDTD
jgi:ankyrin repeat protein